MKRIHVSLVAVLLFVVVPASHAADETKLVEAKKIWECETSVSMTDLVRFKDAWYCVFHDRPKDSPSKTLRVITSADGLKWESAADVPFRRGSRSLPDPRLTVTNKNELMLVATGELPDIGHTNQPYSWTSKDGNNWETPKRFGARNYRVQSVRSHNGEEYSFSRGCICGSYDTVKIHRGGGGKIYEETLSFSPGWGSLVFTRDVAYCILAPSASYRIRDGKYHVHKAPNGLVSSSKPPFNDLSDWKDLGVRIAHPNAIRLFDGRIIASVGLFDKKERTSLCWFDRKAGKLREVLELPVGRSAHVGLASHDGHLWISYHKPHEEKSHVYLAKVKLAPGVSE